MAVGTKTLAPSELDTFEDQRLVEELQGEVEHVVVHHQGELVTAGLDLHATQRRQGAPGLGCLPGREILEADLPRLGDTARRMMCPVVVLASS